MLNWHEKKDVIKLIKQHLCKCDSCLNAYELAVQQGFVGTLDEWLLTLIGPQGIQGIQGPEGPEGPSGELAVENIATLRTIPTLDSINVLGYYEKGDGGGGYFYWDSTSVLPDNGGTIIQSTGITTGRWIRNYAKGRINVKWFGAKTDGVTDCTTAINTALATFGKTGIPSGWGTGILHFPKGVYLVNGTVSMISPIGLVFEGDSEHATVITRTNDTGVLFSLATYISVGFEKMSIRHITATDQSTWTNTCFSLNGIGGGRNFYLDRVFTDKFYTVIKHENTINEDTSYVNSCTFQNCHTFLNSENPQGILNNYSNFTLGGTMQIGFHLAGAQQSTIENANVVIDGVFIKYKNISGKYNDTGLTLTNVKFEYTTAHAVSNPVPKIIDSEGGFIQVNIKMTGCGLRGGSTPHPDTKAFRFIGCGVKLDIETSEIGSLLEITDATLNQVFRGNYIRFQNSLISNPQNWLITDTGLSGRTAPPVILINCTTGITSKNNINLIINKRGPTYLNNNFTCDFGPPNQAIATYSANTTTNFEADFYGQFVSIKDCKWVYNGGGADTAGRMINIYSDAARTVLIGSLELPPGVTDPSLLDIALANTTTKILYVSVVQPVGASFHRGHLRLTYQSI